MGLWLGLLATAALWALLWALTLIVPVWLVLGLLVLATWLAACELDRED